MKSLILKYRNAAFHEKLNRFALSPLGFSLLILTALLITVFDFQINGVAIFVFIGIFMLILCSDILVMAFPLLLASVFASELYNSAEKFLSFIIPEAVLMVLSIIFHLVVYEHKFRYGRSLRSLLAVSVAVTLSGMFCISPGEYFAPSSLFYTAFLGFGMVGIYLILNAYLPEKSDEKRDMIFPRIMYLTGLYAAFGVFFHYIKEFSSFIENPHIIDFQSSNNLSTFLMICLPFAFYYTAKSSVFNIVGALFMYAAIIASGSGGGLLMGSLLFLILFVFLIVYDKKRRIVWSVATALIVISGITLSGFILSKYHFTSFDDIFYSNNIRMSYLRRSLANISNHPVFGVGLCYSGDSDIYCPKPGAMNWYHMMIPQIIGSMGTLGILAYGYQLIERIRLALRHLDLYGVTLSLSYVGLFLMSQVNPGEFCPIPYSLLAVIIFMILERREKCTFRQRLQVKS